MTENRVASPRRKAEDASCKNVDEALCEIDELLQRWDNRISIENLALAKRYLENKMEAGLVLEAVSGTPPVRLDYIAVFKRKLSANNLQTAKALGIEVPETLLATADELIQ